MRKRLLFIVSTFFGLSLFFQNFRPTLDVNTLGINNLIQEGSPYNFIPSLQRMFEMPNHSERIAADPKSVVPDPKKLDASYAHVSWDGRLTLEKAAGGMDYPSGNQFRFRYIKDIKRGSEANQEFLVDKSAAASFRLIKDIYVHSAAIGQDPSYSSNPIQKPGRLIYHTRIYGQLETTDGANTCFEFARDNQNKVLKDSIGKEICKTTVEQGIYNFKNITGKCLGYYNGTDCINLPSALFFVEIPVRVIVSNSGEIEKIDGCRDTDNDPQRDDTCQDFQIRFMTYYDAGVIRPLEGIESSITFDGKLFVYKARVRDLNMPGTVRFFHGISYSHRNDASFPLPAAQESVSPRKGSWEPPRSLADIGNSKEPKDQDLKDQYRIFRKPFVNQDGSTLPFVISGMKKLNVDWSSGIVAGAYPWITPDGENMFFTSLPSGDECNMRAGYAVLGASTNYQLKLIDSGINWSRGMYGMNSCSEKVNSHAVDWIQLQYIRHADQILGNSVWKSDSLSRDFYTKRFATSENETELPFFTYQAFPKYYPTPFRQLVDSPIQKGTAWDPLVFQNQDFREWPTVRSGRADVLWAPMGSGAYGEVSYEDALDGSYFLYWHMNEFVNPVGTINANNYHRSIDIQKTPDTSGNFRTGLMTKGAHFSQERRWIDLYGRAHIPTPVMLTGSTNKTPTTIDEMSAQSRNLVDIISNDYAEGFNGQSVSFRAESCIEVNNTATNKATINRGLNDFTFETWIKIENANFAVKNILSIPGAFDLGYVLNTTTDPSTSSVILSYLDVQNKSQTLQLSDQNISFNKWTHIALRVINDTITFFVNGNYPNANYVIKLPKNTKIYSKIYAQIENLKLGPCTAITEPLYLYSLDELSISTVSRTPFEILAHAYRATPRSKIPNPTAVSKLGDLLFNKPFVGVDGRKVSCASCHSEANRFFAPSVLPEMVHPKRTVPSTLFSGMSNFFMADGSATSIENQVVMPLKNPLEHNVSIDSVTQQVNADKFLAPKFLEAFSAKPTDSPLSVITEDNIKIAFKAYLINKTSGVSFRGERIATMRQLNIESTVYSQSDSAVSRGFEVFRGKGRCTGCHSGTALTDNQFHDTGRPLQPLRLGAEFDQGRFSQTQSDSDKGKFKTSSLWNIKYKTEGFFHDGESKTLDEVIEFYNKAQIVRGTKDYNTRNPEIIPLGLTPQNKLDLKSFLMFLETDN